MGRVFGNAPGTYFRQILKLGATSCASGLSLLASAAVAPAAPAQRAPEEKEAVMSIAGGRGEEAWGESSAVICVAGV